ncbi:hypothetical protein Tco_0201357 [Tanacetum coccineum]
MPVDSAAWWHLLRTKMPQEVRFFEDNDDYHDEPTDESYESFVVTPAQEEGRNILKNSVIESLPISPIPVEDSEPTQEEIDILLIPDNLIPPGGEDADSEDEVNESPNLGSPMMIRSIPRPTPEPTVLR